MRVEAGRCGSLLGRAALGLAPCMLSTGEGRAGPRGKEKEEWAGRVGLRKKGRWARSWLLGCKGLGWFGLSRLGLGFGIPLYLFYFKPTQT